MAFGFDDDRGTEFLAAAVHLRLAEQGSARPMRSQVWQRRRTSPFAAKVPAARSSVWSSVLPERANLGRSGKTPTTLS